MIRKSDRYYYINIYYLSIMYVYVHIYAYEIKAINLIEKTLKFHLNLKHIF